MVPSQILKSRYGDLVLAPKEARRAHRSPQWLDTPVHFTEIRNVNNGLQPLAFHFPRLYNFPKQANYASNMAHWGKIIRYAWQRVRFKPEDLKDVTVVTWNNAVEPCLLELFAQRMGVPIVVLGKGISPWRNYFKISSALEGLNRINTEYFMALDGNDCVFISSPQVAIDTLVASGAEMLFGAQMMPFPRGREFEDFQRLKAPKGCANMFMNSGQYIARTLSVASLFREAAAISALEREASDQDRWQQVMRRHPEKVQLDYERRLFYVCTTGSSSRDLLKFV